MIRSEAAICKVDSAFFPLVPSTRIEGTREANFRHIERTVD